MRGSTSRSIFRALPNLDGSLNERTTAANQNQRASTEQTTAANQNRTTAANHNSIYPPKIVKGNTVCMGCSFSSTSHFIICHINYTVLNDVF